LVQYACDTHLLDLSHAEKSRGQLNPGFTKAGLSSHRQMKKIELQQAKDLVESQQFKIAS
jgi:hypothetical protein